MQSPKFRMIRTEDDDPPALLAQLREGRREAYDAVYHRHAGRVYAVALRMLRHPQSAEDATQMAFVRAFRSLHLFRADSKLSTWLHRIVVNVCLDELTRSRTRNTHELPESVSDGSNLEQDSIDRQLLAELHAIMADMPHAKVATLNLYYADGLTADEIAATLDESRSTVLKRLSRLRDEILHSWHKRHPGRPALSARTNSLEPTRLKREGGQS